MNKSHNKSARASALQIVMAIAFMAASAILLASTFRAAQSSNSFGNRPDPVLPNFTCGGGNVRVDQDDEPVDCDLDADAHRSGARQAKGIRR